MGWLIQRTDNNEYYYFSTFKKPGNSFYGELPAYHIFVNEPKDGMDFETKEEAIERILNLEHSGLFLESDYDGGTFRFTKSPIECIPTNSHIRDEKIDEILL